LLGASNLSGAQAPTPQPAKPAPAPADKPAQVPPSHPVPAPDKKAAPTKPAQKPVDINKASVAELTKLPGIGDAEAKKIIAARPFRTKADLVTQNIIPEGVYVSIKDKIVAGNPGQGLKQQPKK
jgi:DNA uptake protein ComE-like DNA-binding protein